MKLQLMDCTLRDGANVVGKGFSAELTDMVLDGLTASRVPIIEFGNAGGIGAYEVAGFTDALTDEEYLNISKKYLNRSSMLGMFLNAKRYREKNVDLAAENGLSFLRVGADAGDGEIAVKAIGDIKKRKMKAFYSAMKAYILTPDELAEEGKKLEAAGLDEFTIMDSAGTMLPDEVAAYTEKLCRAVTIPVAFHGHNNLGMSAANAVAAWENGGSILDCGLFLCAGGENGASILDCGLMGMARSAGNLATEMCVALMRRRGQMEDIDFYGMLDFIDQRLQPAMEQYKYHNPVPPLDLVLGYSGCHSSFVKQFKAAAAEKNVSLYRLISEVSEINKKNPKPELIAEIAESL